MDYYSLNVVILIGHVGHNPEVRVSKPGRGVKTPRKMAKFQLSTREIYIKSEKPVTIWHNCYAWGGRADFIEKYVKAGTLLCVQGKLSNYMMTDSDGKVRRHIYVSIDTVGFMPADKRFGIGQGVKTLAAEAEENGSLPEGDKDPIDKGNPFE